MNMIFLSIKYADRKKKILCGCNNFFAYETKFVNYLTLVKHFVVHVNNVCSTESVIFLEKKTATKEQFPFRLFLRPSVSFVTTNKSTVFC